MRLAARRSPLRAPARGLELFVRAIGGPGRARVVVLFAAVLALENADQTAVGAAAPQLKGAFHISEAQLGLLASISTMVGALGTIPVGSLADRLPRVRLLVGAVALWAVAMSACAAAPGYTWLLLSRLGLGAVTAAGGPLIVSLIGDFFPARDRARILGFILSGELVGAGFGFMASGTLAGALSWRWAFIVLAVPAVLLALCLARMLSEPERGAQGSLSEGEAPHGGRAEPPRRGPAGLSLRAAILYVLRIRTNLWLIAASTVGYFFFAGLRTFGVVFVRAQFTLLQSPATLVLFLAGLGSVAGVLASGRLADRLLARGASTARLLVSGAAYLAAAGLLLPALLTRSLALAFPFLFLGAAGLAAPNPPLDAARLDIVPPSLWGRAEGVRTMVRQGAQAGAPLLFGLVADSLGGSSSGQGAAVSRTSAHALDLTFLIMLAPLTLSGVMLLLARRGYPRDVARASNAGPARRPEGRGPRRSEHDGASPVAVGAG